MKNKLTLFVCSILLCLTYSCTPSAAGIIKKYAGKYVIIKSDENGKALTVIENDHIALRKTDPVNVEHQIFQLKNVYDSKGNPYFYLVKDDLLGIRTTGSGFKLETASNSLDFLFTGDLVNKKDSTKFQLYRPVTIDDITKRGNDKDQSEIPIIWIADGDEVFLGTPSKGNIPTTQKIVWSISEAGKTPFNFPKSQDELKNKEKKERLVMGLDSTYYLENRFNDLVVGFSGTKNDWSTQPKFERKEGASLFEIKKRLLTQQFRFVAQGNNEYLIQNIGTGKYLSYLGLLESDGIPLYERDLNSEEHQKFIIEWSSISPGYKKIRAANANMYLGLVASENKLLLVPEERSELQEFDIVETGLFSQYLKPGDLLGIIHPEYIIYKCNGFEGNNSSKEMAPTALFTTTTNWDFYRNTGDFEYRYDHSGSDMETFSRTLEKSNHCYNNTPHRHRVDFTLNEFTFLNLKEFHPGNYNVQLPIKVYGRPKKYDYRKIKGKPSNAPLSIASCKKICWRKISKPAPEGMVNVGMLYGKNANLVKKQIAYQGKVVADFVAGFAFPSVSGKGASTAFTVVKKITKESEYYLTVGANAIIDQYSDAVITAGIDYLTEYIARETGLPKEIIIDIANYDPTGLYSMASAFILPFCDECDE